MNPAPEEAVSVAGHWDDVYRTRRGDEVSWFQAEPSVSLSLIESTAPAPASGIVDIGGGASLLVDHLVTSSYRDITVLDVSATAMEIAKGRLGARADEVDWVSDDVLRWKPTRLYGVWHDRAVFHFLTDDRQRRVYLEAMRSALVPGGFVVMATFAEDGPTQCSGLPTARYSPAELAALMPLDFEVISSSREEHTTPDGRIQPFTWMVFRSTTD